MVDIGYEGNDRWNIPDDRQLALRGRLETGWSSYKGNVFSHSSSPSLSEEEQQLILSVLQRQESKESAEQQRIGLLVNHLEQMRKNVLGDGQNTCLICGTKTGLLKDSSHYCTICKKMVCSKCGIDSSKDPSYKVYYCVLCHEERQLWKRSGAWFYNSIPKYVQPDHNGTLSRSEKGTSQDVDVKNQGTVGRCAPSPYTPGMHQPVMRNASDHSSEGLPRVGSIPQIQAPSESIDEGSDDSDIETASAKAFEIAEDQRSITWHGQIDMEEDGMSGRVTKRSSEVVSQRPSHIKGTLMRQGTDEVDNNPRLLSQEHKYGSQSSLSRMVDAPSSPPRSLPRSPRFDRQISESSITSAGEKKHKLGIRKPWRKKSRDNEGSLSSQEEKSTHLSSFEGGGSGGAGDDGGPVGDSVSNTGSDQDIDQMFKAYESEQQTVKQEYHGKYGVAEFTLQYDPNTQELLVIIHKCKGLKGDKGKVPSAFVRTIMLPEASKASKKRTSTIKHNSDPVFDETLVYHGVDETHIQSKGLRLSVMDESKLGSSVLGETSIPLKNLTTRPVQQFRRILDARSNDDSLFLDTKNIASNPGRIEIALHYLSKQEKLVVEIIRCSGLKAMDPNGYSDPYVKCYLLPDPAKRTKKKTTVKKKTLNPEFNEEFSYKIAHGELAKRTLHVSVWDYDMGRTNDFIGGIMLGIESTGDALRHWFDTLKVADKRVIKWHTLSEHCPIINE